MVAASVVPAQGGTQKTRAYDECNWPQGVLKPDARPEEGSQSENAGS